MIDRRELGAIFLGGALGALVRAGLGEALPAPGVGWPWATFVVNVVGAALLGYWFTVLPHSQYRRPLLTTGFCGALTTFSTVQVELVEMIDAGRVPLAGLYLAVSVAAGLVGAQAATALARRTEAA
ncbi:MAG TPA: fluoride efflux transporter CrcB [Solirubrobacterales bacterium]|nr:fluoride efflux transporter CrcB [Solirubrobacterales bacterium]